MAFLGLDGPAMIAAIVGALFSIVLIYYFGGPSKPALDPKQWQQFPLTNKHQVSPNTAIYRFALPKKDQRLGLPIGQHIQVKATIDGKEKMRSYTPVSSDDDKGYFDLMIKSYPTGNISKMMGEMKIGDMLTVKGPKGNMKYHPYYALQLAMIAGGTGITPMLQIIRAVLKNPSDITLISLIYANVNYEDILLKSELDDLVRAHPRRFQIYYVLNNPPDNWKGGKGFVTKEMIQSKLPHPTSDVKTLLCGPPPMIGAMKKCLDELGYDPPKPISKIEDSVFVF